LRLRKRFTKTSKIISAFSCAAMGFNVRSWDSQTIDLLLTRFLELFNTLTNQSIKQTLHWLRK
jgi:hypothetical protein